MKKSKKVLAILVMVMVVVAFSFAGCVSTDLEADLPYCAKCGVFTDGESEVCPECGGELILPGDDDYPVEEDVVEEDVVEDEGMDEDAVE